MTEPLRAWLAGLDEDGLTQLLTNRPDLCAYRRPDELSELALHLLDPNDTTLAVRRLDLPALQGLEALLVLSALDPDSAPAKARLAGFLAAPVEQLDALFDRYEAHGLAWRGRHGRVHLNPSVPPVLPVPMGLGPSIRPTLEQSTVVELKGMADRLGLRKEGRKSEIIDRCMEFYLDHEQMAALYESAPAEVQALLKPCVWDGEVHQLDVALSMSWYSKTHDDGPFTWAYNRGLLVPTASYSPLVYMPLEVGLTLRGPNYKAPYDPEPPTLPTRPTEPASSSAHQRQVGLRLLDRAATIVDGSRTRPLAALKNELAVGSREVRRLAKAMVCRPDEVYLVLELVSATELLDWDEDSNTFQPSEKYAAWSAMPPGKRLETLVLAWWSLPRSPLTDVDGKGRRANPLSEETDIAAGHVRSVLMTVLTELAEDVAVADPGDLAAVLEWRASTMPRELLIPRLESTLLEADLLGVVHDHAITELGRTLCPLDSEALSAVCGETVAQARSTVLFGADLTATATGPPGPDLAGYLDQIADREAQDSATVWRFSPHSVRRAMDIGHQADDLLAGLESVAEQGIPQPLSYLIRDVARRHGEVTVKAVTCCVLSDDPALLREVLVHKKLAALEPQLLAPTVLGCGRPPVETVDLLRKAGYYPAPLPGGTVQLRTAAAAAPVAASPAATGSGATGFCATGSGATGSGSTTWEPDLEALDPDLLGVGVVGPAEARALARTLVGTDVEGVPVRSRRQNLAPGSGVSRLAPEEVAALQMAVNFGGVLSIIAAGEETLLSDIEFADGGLEGWCELSQSLRRVELDDITFTELVEPPLPPE